MSTEQYDRIVNIVRYVVAAGSVVAGFLLAQSDVELLPVTKVALGAYLALAAFVKTSTIANALPGVSKPADG